MTALQELPTTWLDIPAEHPFGIQTLPYGSVLRPDGPRVGVAIGDHVLDLTCAVRTLLPARTRLFAAFPDFARITSLRCACHEYRMVAQGHAEFCLSGPTPHPWDHAAGVLAVESAGGVARFLDGASYEARRRKGVILAAGSEDLWQSLARRFAFLA